MSGEYEEKTKLLGDGEMGQANSAPFTDLTDEERKNFIKTRNMLVLAAFAVLISMSLGIVIAVVVNFPTAGASVTLTEATTGALSAKRTSFQWIDYDDGSKGAAAQDGVSTYANGSDIYIRTPPTFEPTLLVVGADVINPDTEAPIDFFSYVISANTRYVLYGTNFEQVWRHSYTATYYVLDTTTMAVNKIYGSNLQLAVFSPASTGIAFVVGNNLWLYHLNNHISEQITHDGSADILNAVPAWVYEEEVFGSNSALWWSPDGSFIAYLKSNESEVPIFTYPIYGSGAYPEQVQVKYPKAGYTNPTWEIHFFEVDSQSEGSIDFGLDEETYIIDLAWVSGSTFLTRLVPRVQTSSTLYLVDVLNTQDPSVTELSTQTRTNGWIDYAQLKPISDALGNPFYLDIVDINGYNHLVNVPIQAGADYIQLTGLNSSISYEVLAIVGYNPALQTAYVLTTHAGPTERHLFEVTVVFNAGSVPTETQLDPVGVEGYYSVSFSTYGTYYLLTYDGPNVPYQLLLSVNNSAIPEPVNITIEDNAALQATLETYAMPKVTYFTVVLADSVGNETEFNVMQISPERFDIYNQDYYPVVHHVYGGPASQLVLKRYTVDWHTYLATSLGYVVFQMDARGTSGRGNAWKDAVYKQLGSAEAQDQLAFGAWIKSQSYVKKDQVYVWGWSYGGYLASKILEADANNVYTGGIAVAPVSDWKFYDSIYTERYMLTPQENPNGYLQSAVSNFTNFYDKRYLLVHGTEDDNVHYQNAAVLVWNLVAAAVPFEMFAYTDNDHSINTGPNTTNDLYSRLTAFVQNQ